MDPHVFRDPFEEFFGLLISSWLFMNPVMSLQQVRYVIEVYMNPFVADHGSTGYIFMEALRNLMYALVSGIRDERIKKDRRDICFTKHMFMCLFKTLPTIERVYPFYCHFLNMIDFPAFHIKVII